MPTHPWPLFLSFLLLHATGLAQPLPADSLVAPNGALHLRLWLDAQGVPTYTVTHGTERVQLVAPSRLGFVFLGGDTLQQGLVLERREQGAYDSTWTAVWGPQRHVRDHHRWLRWYLRDATGERRLEVEFRVSDEGVAFRCVVPARASGDSLVVLEELSELALPLDAEAWWACSRSTSWACSRRPCTIWRRSSSGALRVRWDRWLVSLGGTANGWHCGPFAKLQLHVCQRIRQAPLSAGHWPIC